MPNKTEQEIQGISSYVTRTENLNDVDMLAVAIQLIRESTALSNNHAKMLTDSIQSAITMVEREQTKLPCT